MNNNIFYSWQSDLPNNENRGFIESCISAAIKELNKMEEFHLELNLDRDTKNELGTPDIVNTIFSKIERSKLFIADISIINKDSGDRKTPNPNVLLELGYAAKVLGWEKVICIFNTDYGDFSELPFDLRFRRPLSYSLKGKDRQEVKKFVTRVISQTINDLYTKGLLDDELNDYLKMQVDTQILSIVGHLSKIIYGYETENSKLDSYRLLLDLKVDGIKTILKDRKFCGFQVFKNFGSVERELHKILDSFTSTNYFQREIGLMIVSLIKWINRFDKFNSLRTSPDLFIGTNEKVLGYKTVNAPDINPNNDDSYILLNILGGDYGQVVDFGMFQETSKIDSILYYVYLNEKYNDLYANLIYDFIEIVEKWLSISNGEFIIDNLTHFELANRNRNIPQKKILELASKPVSFEEEIGFLIKENFNFDYANIAQMNALIHFIRQGYILGNHTKVLENIQRQVKGKLNFNGNMSVIPMDDELEKKDLSENERQIGLENLKNIRQGSFEIDCIYITHKYANLKECLSRLSKNQLIGLNTRELLEKIIKDSELNLITHLIEPIRMFVIKNANENHKAPLNTISVYDEFNKIRIYHDRDINKLISEIRHLIGNR